MHTYRAIKWYAISQSCSRDFVPKTTLRDRLLGKVDPECVTSGKAPVSNMEEKARLAEHLKVMASYVYGYTRQEVVDIATDYRVQLKIRTQINPLTLKWF